jgi:hypothetical protein
MAHRLVIMGWRVIEASDLIDHRHASGEMVLGPGDQQGAQALVPPGVPSRLTAGEDPWEDPRYDWVGWRWIIWQRSLYAQPGGPKGILPPTKHQEISLAEAALMIQMNAPAFWGWFEKTVRSRGSTLHLISRPNSDGSIEEVNEVGKQQLMELRLDAAPVFGDEWVREHLHTPVRSPSG